MTALALSAFVALVAQCAPDVAPETMAAIARTESGFNPHAIGVNGAGGGARAVSSRSEAIAVATDLIVNQRRSVDLGVMQVNSANLGWLGLSIADAFDPCRNIAAGARILRGGYAGAGQDHAGQQRALRVAFSRYNTGSPERGFANGYVRKVEASARYAVPAIQGDGIPAVRAETPARQPESNPFVRASAGRNLVFNRNKD